MAENELIVNICGKYPEDFVDVDINSNPNYIFENDIKYETVQLFDYDTNTVFVNSFIECHDVLFNISTLLIFISIFTFKKLFNK